MRASLALLLILAANAADACTTFCTRGLFGRNYDFETGSGMLFVNKRGLAKTAHTANPVTWTSRHGSVTFNQFGRDNATGGMNEQGLVVELMWLDQTRYPAPDARPELGVLEWVQFQLDTAATVAEVVANAKRVRIADTRAPLHFLVSDAKGDVAAIEFLGGKLVVHRGDSLPVPVLANDTYEESVSGMRTQRTARFTRAANGLKSAATVDGAFALLDEVRLPSTQWSIVYDIRNRTITWRTAANRQRRVVRLAALDFGCATPLRVLDVDARHPAGVIAEAAVTTVQDVTGSFRDYTRAENEALVRRSVRATSFLRHMTDAEIVEAARWPERARCAATVPTAPGTPSATMRRP